MSHLPAVGIIGLGDQGAPIAQAIAHAGYPLNVWARRPAALAALDGMPHTACDSATSLAAASELVALCLPEDSDTFEIAVNGGLLAHMHPGSILVNHGTGLPQAARELAEHASAYGVETVDAPVSGGHAAAVARQLTTIAGGRREIVDRCTPVFRTFSKEVIYMGAAGAGQLGKLFNNTLMMMNHKNITDILDVAQALDLELPALLEVLRSGSASSTALLAFGSAITVSNAQHLRELELIDMDLFGRAVAAHSGQAAAVIERAVAGAQALPGLTARITS